MLTPILLRFRIFETSVAAPCVDAAGLARGPSTMSNCTADPKPLYGLEAYLQAMPDNSITLTGLLYFGFLPKPAGVRPVGPVRGCYLMCTTEGAILSVGDSSV